VERSIFKAYDIRGIYPEELSQESAYLIGKALADFLNSEKVLIGRDARPSGNPLKHALVKGIMDRGVGVWDMGLITTPMVSFAAGKTGFPGIMVTASHNPPEYNGFKIIDRDVLPVGWDFGLNAVYERIMDGELPSGEKNGCIKDVDFLNDYTDFLLSKVGIGRKLKVCIDAFNGTTPVVLEKVLPEIDIDFIPLNFDIDGTYPKHPPNPLDYKNLEELKNAVLENGADFGVAFDGDGDRCVFVDEKGEPVSPDLITAILAREMGVKDEWVLVDVRTSRSVVEEIEKLGGKPERVRVGHAYARRRLKELDGKIGGELAGHYYFKEMFYADSGILAYIHVLNYFSNIDTEFSQVIGEIKRYVSTGEVNFRIEDKDGAIEKVKDRFSDGKINMLDGLTVEYEDWWFNLRKSNTEPYLRLIVEAREKGVLEERFREIKGIIKEFS